MCLEKRVANILVLLALFLETVNCCHDPSQEKETGNFRAKVEFRLFTKKKPDDPKIIDENTFYSEYKNDGYNPEYKTIIIIHGYFTKNPSKLVNPLKANFFTRTDENYNIISADWSRYSLFAYPYPVGKMKSLGAVVAKFLDFLVREVNTSPDNIHCIGHSLGAHVCGFAGQLMSYGKMNRITALDPANPGFKSNLPSERVDKSDAKFVDCIHTSNIWGILDPICTADFYPNGGKVQLGWKSIFTIGTVCHSLSHAYFAESLLEGHEFPSVRCRNRSFNADNCNTTEVLMGYPASSTLEGIYYCETETSYPYAKKWTFNSGISTTKKGYIYLWMLAFVTIQKSLWNY